MDLSYEMLFIIASSIVPHVLDQGAGFDGEELLPAC